VTHIVSATPPAKLFASWFVKRSQLVNSPDCLLPYHCDEDPAKDVGPLFYEERRWETIRLFSRTVWPGRVFGNARRRFDPQVAAHV
jgi:hypothetical protein